ncbi:MAG: hypothetical protein F4179_06805 [Gammaproteobacteria bacterium]|nr:hypothetical protein [Gammaproteobacteria bacterium]
MTIPAHRTPTPYWLTFLLLCGIAACDAADSDLPLIVQRDSAGIQIIEAMRPLWADSSLWRLDPQPLLDLTLSGSGPSHEFFRVRGVTQRPDGALVLANRGAQEIRLYSSEGEFLGAMGGRGQGPGEFSNLQRLKLVGDTLVVLDYDGRVTVVGPDMELVRTFTLPHNVQDLHPLGDGTMLGESTVWAGLEEVVNQLIRPPLGLVRFDLGGSRIDSIGVRPGRESYSFSYEDNAGDGPALFAKIGQVAALGSRVFYGSSNLMQVEELDPAGDITRILRIPGFGLEFDRRSGRRRAGCPSRCRSSSRHDNSPVAPEDCRSAARADYSTRLRGNACRSVRGDLAGAVSGQERTGRAPAMAHSGRRWDLARDHRDAGPLQRDGHHHGCRTRRLAR